MSDRPGPVYESRVFVAPESLADYESWIGEQIEVSKRSDGVVDVFTFELTPDAAGWPGRVCQFALDDDEALERFVDGLATEIEAAALERFGDAISWQERILREDASRELPAGEMPECLNCDAHLRGQYCGQCGQRGSSRLISLWELIRDAFGDLFELDSRLWRTLVPLMIRPGRLTHDYLQGRRARYMPPFRMYLVLSLLFFLVAFFDPRETFGIFYEPQTAEELEAERLEEAAEQHPEAAEIADEVRRGLAEEGIIVAAPEALDPADEDPDAGISIHIDGDGPGEANCEGEDFDFDGPEWLKRRLTPERLVHICKEVAKDSGRQLWKNLYDNLPLALIVLLPIMAFVLKVLYPLSRRYYVEHLLFFVHFHAFAFLILTLQILLGRVNAMLPTPEAIGILVIVAASFYVPVYLFVAMRRVYGQGRLITAFKYVVLTGSYLAGLTVTMVGALLMAALSVGDSG
jgi:hypothetical protein